MPPSGYVARKIASTSTRGSVRSLLARKAAQRLEALQSSQARPSSTEPLLDFVPRISPHLLRPDWFAPYAAKLEEATERPVRVVFAAPPQHGKTVVTSHAFAWWLAGRLPKRHAYISYNSERAEDVSIDAQHLVAETGLQVEGNRRLWRCGQGRVLWTGIGGALTGYGIDGCLVVDDPIKNRAEAESKTIRERAHQWLRDVALTRLHPGASVVVMATRWHPDDLSGRLIEEGWEYINLPAVAEGEGDPLGRSVGEALAPSIRPREFLDAQRREVGEYSWASLWQGRPRPRGGAVFHEPGFYSSLPTRGYRGLFGLDLAYTAKTSADWSVCVELWAAGDKFYVVDVVRKQVEAPSFALALRAKQTARPWRFRWRASGTEKGAASFLKSKGIPLDVVRPHGDKFVCAQSVAAAWNEGRVLLPDPEAFPEADRWLGPFLESVQNFTGIGDEQDDDVDALGAAFDGLQSVSGIKRGRLGLKPRM